MTDIRAFRPAILDPEQHPAIRRIILASLRSRLELPYWVLAVALAAWLSWYSYARASLPYLPCEDRHCSDPGTLEYRHALKTMNESAGDYAVSTLVAIIVLAVILRLAAFAWGSLLVAIFGDIRASASRAEETEPGQSPLP